MVMADLIHPRPSQLKSDIDRGSMLLPRCEVEHRVAIEGKRNFAGRER
jgi:hypothetical protein